MIDSHMHFKHESIYIKHNYYDRIHINVYIYFLSSMKLIDATTTATFLFECSMRWVGVRLDLASSMINVATALVLIVTKGSVTPALAGLALTMCIKVILIYSLSKIYIDIYQ